MSQPFVRTKPSFLEGSLPYVPFRAKGVTLCRLPLY